MSLITLKQVKKDLKVNYSKIYGNLSVDEVIINQIKPYNFNIAKIEEYREYFYKSIYNFLNTNKYFVARPFWRKLLSDEYVDGYVELLKKEVDYDFFEKTVKLGKK